MELERDAELDAEVELGVEVELDAEVELEADMRLALLRLALRWAVFYVTVPYQVVV